MAKPDKVAAVAEIAESFRTSSATVVTQYSGLSVAQLSKLRRALGTSAKYRVAKNTLVKRAAEDAGIEGLEHLFVGPTAIAFVDGEAVDAAKAIRDFAKENNALASDRTSAEHGAPVRDGSTRALRYSWLPRLSHVCRRSLSPNASPAGRPHRDYSA
jgi:ribosomal protein L10